MEIPNSAEIVHELVTLGTKNRLVLDKSGNCDCSKSLKDIGDSAISPSRIIERAKICPRKFGKNDRIFGKRWSDWILGFMDDIYIVYRKIVKKDNRAKNWKDFSCLIDEN